MRWLRFRHRPGHGATAADDDVFSPIPIARWARSLVAVDVLLVALAMQSSFARNGSNLFGGALETTERRT